MVVPDPLPLRRIDHVKFFVGNAKQSAYFYRNAFGFDVMAYSGLETKVKNEASYVLKQGLITFVLTSPLHEDHPENYRLMKHGDGVMDIAIEVDDVQKTYDTVIKRGAKSVMTPKTLSDELGQLDVATIAAYGDTRHSFINRDRYKGVFAPGYKTLDPDRYGPPRMSPVGLRAIDHIVANVEEGKMTEWVKWYEEVMGFSLLVSFDDKDISTEYSALMSKVMQNGTGKIKFPINEPAQAKRKSQIEEYLNFYHGPGVQHIAMVTGDIVKTVSAMVQNDVSFLRVPKDYYDTLTERVGKINEDIGSLAPLGILVDRDEDGYLLQIFTKPVEDRPTLFFEVIERHGAQSFGKGNFKALFEAIEREQDRRGTL
ncbi:MAG: 4-hydroxyphenylpyruvate dioxygenase [Gemmatales bacterium]